KMETLSWVIPLPTRQSSLPFGTPDVSPVIRQVTLHKEKPSCLRESQHRLPARAGVIIRGQKSIPLMACPSGISTNMPKAATGTHASASSTSKAAAQAQHLHRPLPHLLAAGQPALTSLRLERGSSGSFSRLTGSFTSWVAATSMTSSSLIRLSTIRWLTRERQSQPLTPTALPTTWLAAYLTTAERTTSTARAVPISPARR